MFTGLKLCIIGLAMVLLASAAASQERESPEEQQAESLVQITQPLYNQQLQSTAQNTENLAGQQAENLAQNTSPLINQQIGSLAVNQTYNESFADYNVSLAYSSQIGQYLVDSRGMTLYYLANDTGTTSTCYGQCAVNWPPFYNNVPSEPVELGASDFTAITRSDGKLQTAYRGRPLYYFIGDRVPGDINGQGKNGVWFVASIASLQQAR